MNQSCPGCGADALNYLTVGFRYPREEFLPVAVEPWYVQGSAPLITCGSIECEAAGLLAVIDGIITDTALSSSRLLTPEDVHIVHIGDPGDRSHIFIAEDRDEAS